MDVGLVDHITSKEELLKFLNEDDRKLFVNALEKKSVKADEVLEKLGEPQTAVYIIEEGELVRTKADESNITLSRGDVTGLLHFFTRDPAAATVKGGKNGATVWTTTSEKFMKIVHENPTFSTSYITFLNSKVRKSLNVISKINSQLTPGGVRIAFFDAKPYMKDVFTKVNESKGYKFQFTWVNIKLTKDTAQLASGHEIVCCFVNDKVDADTVHILSQFGVKMIALRCAGYNNVDLKATEAESISVTRVPAYSPYAVAEFAVSLMLTLNRKIHKAYNRVREGNFDLTHLVGFDMHGKTVGVFGTGKIGWCTANILLGFGCKVLALDVREDDDLKKKGVVYVTKDELLKQSDIITLHAPLLPSTTHWMNKDAFNKVKKGAYLINTSRGALVDTSALLDALLDGRIGAAGLDVIEGEEKLFFENRENELIQDQVMARIISLPNVLLTSHQAFLTMEALNAIAESTLGSVKEFADGKSGNDLTNAVKQEYK